MILCTDLHGWLPGAPFPLSVNIVCLIIEALTAAEQGQKALYPIVHCMGNMAQDMAWIKLAPQAYPGVPGQVRLQRCDDYRHAVPPRLPFSPSRWTWAGLSLTSTISPWWGRCARCNAVDLRSIDEGAGVPTKDTNAVSYRSAKWIFDVIREQQIEIDIKEVEAEEKVTEIEVRAIMDRILDLGDGDIVDGTIKAVESGVLDSPWSPNINVKDKVLGVRDAHGACRYLEFGNLPYPGRD